MNSFFARVILIPSAVFLSVIFGGAYGSGREIVSYISRNGPYGGLISILTICLFYTAVLYLCFEIARLFRTYEYNGFSRILLKKFWPAYELLIMIGLIVTLAICASAAGAISYDHFGVSAILGGAVLLAIIVTLNFFGREVVEKSMMISVAALGLALIYLLYANLSKFGPQITDIFSTAANDKVGGIKNGLTYAQTSGGFIPILLYCAVQLRSRKEVFIASFVAALCAVLPAIALHISFMASYPAILDETVPSYWMVEKATSPFFLNIYVAIVFVMVAQTGVGLLHGVLERIDDWVKEKRGKALSHTGHALVAAGAFLLSLGFASIGLVELIFKAFTFFSNAFLIVFFLPLFTYGIWLIVKNRDPISVEENR
ncbi:hypothetical protein OAH55_06785 [Hellea sp.]|nr:hypothetical protein [Hellea sp.]MDB4845236.1 hypothetical protein [Hellea sp.]